MVELAGAAPHEDVVVGELAVVDLGPRHLQILGGGDRRDVLHVEAREPLGGRLVHRAEGEPVAVGEGEALVDPGSVRQALGGQLPRREHDLAELSVDHVAVVVDARELVIGPDLLNLGEGVEERAVVPEPDVVEGRSVGLDVLEGQRIVGLEVALAHGAEPPAPPGRLDVPGDEGGLLLGFVGEHTQPVDQRRVEPHAEYVHAEEEHQAQPDEHRPLAGGGDGDEEGREHADGDLGLEHRQLRVGVGVARARHWAHVAEEQLGDGQPGVEGEGGEHERAQHAEVRSRRAGGLGAGGRAPAGGADGERASQQMQPHGEEQ